MEPLSIVLLHEPYSVDRLVFYRYHPLHVTRSVVERSYLAAHEAQIHLFYRRPRCTFYNIIVYKGILVREYVELATFKMTFNE